MVAKLHEANVPATYNIDHAYGTADYAARFVERLRDVGVDEVMCMIQMGAVPQDVCMETIRQWGESIIPKFRWTRAKGAWGGPLVLKTCPQITKLTTVSESPVGVSSTVVNFGDSGQKTI